MSLGYAPLLNSCLSIFVDGCIWRAPTLRKHDEFASQLHSGRTVPYTKWWMAVVVRETDSTKTRMCARSFSRRHSFLTSTDIEVARTRWIRGVALFMWPIVSFHIARLVWPTDPWELRKLGSIAELARPCQGSARQILHTLILS